MGDLRVNTPAPGALRPLQAWLLTGARAECPRPQMSSALTRGRAVLTCPRPSQEAVLPCGHRGALETWNSLYHRVYVLE